MRTNLFSLLGALWLGVAALPAQSFTCLNSSSNPDAFAQAAERGAASICDPGGCAAVTVRLTFHVVHQDNGSGGYTESDVTACKNLLNTAFNARGISFIYNTTHHWNKSYYLTCSDLEMLGIFGDPANQRTPNAVHVYLVKNLSVDAGKAETVPSNACFVSGDPIYNGVQYQLVPSHAVTHEVGHCLALEHTFNNYTNGAPYVESSPCTMGDFVADTPVDPVTRKECMIPGTCNYQPYAGLCPLTDNNGNAYAPNLNNIMGYTLTTCMTSFTAGQGDRMRENAVLGVPAVFSLTSAQKQIVAATSNANICPLGSQSFSLGNFPTCFPTPTWSASPANLVNLSVNGLSCTATPAGSSAGWVTITATFFNGDVSTIQRYVGGPNILGTYANNGGTFTMNTVNPVKAGQTVATMNTPDPSVNSFTFQLTNGSVQWFITTSNSVNFGLASGSITIEIRANPCGQRRSVTFYVGSGGWGLSPPEVWPNPAGSQLNLRFYPGSDEEAGLAVAARETAAGDDFLLRFFDSLGRPWREFRVADAPGTTLDVADWPAGVYVLSLQKGGQEVRSKVVIAR